MMTFLLPQLIQEFLQRCPLHFQYINIKTIYMYYTFVVCLTTIL